MTGVVGVLVTGSRSWDDWQFIWRKLDGILQAHPIGLVLYHGDAPGGADRHADAWAISRQAVVHRYPADWAMHGRSAGHRRNGIMVRDFYWRPMVARYPLAFRRGGESSKGTTGCVKCIKRAGDTPIVFEYETRYAS